MGNAPQHQVYRITQIDLYVTFQIIAELVGLAYV